MNRFLNLAIITISIFPSLILCDEILFHITPYLQTPKNDGIKVRWEAPLTKDYVVKFGAQNSDLNNTATPSLIHNRSIFVRKKLGVYEAQLEGLIPKTRYYYQVTSGQKRSQIYSFKTLKREKGSFAFIVASDAQNGQETTETVIRDSMMYHAFAGYTQKEKFPISFSLFPGDLVQRGIFHHLWKKQFFRKFSILKRNLIFIK